MKYGFRTPSIRKSISAKTTGKVKRAVKKTVNPSYGKKGIGFINNPKGAVYNKVYNKTTVGVNSIYEKTSRKNSKSSKDYSCSYDEFNKKNQPISVAKVGLGIYTCGISLLFTGVRKKSPKK